MPVQEFDLLLKAGYSAAQTGPGRRPAQVKSQRAGERQ